MQQHTANRRRTYDDDDDDEQQQKSDDGDDGTACCCPSTSATAQLLVTEAVECSNSVKTTTINNNNSRNSSRRNPRSSRRTDGRRGMYSSSSSLPLKEFSGGSDKNSPRLFKIVSAGAAATAPSPRQQIRHVFHANANGGSSKRAPPPLITTKTTRTRTKALEEQEADDEDDDEADDDDDDEADGGQQQRQWQSKIMMMPFFGQKGTRRRRRKRSKTRQIRRRRLLLISSMISCASLLLFSLLISLVFFTQHFSFFPTAKQQNDDNATTTIIITTPHDDDDGDDDLSRDFGNTEVISRRLRGAYSDMRPYKSGDAQIWLLNTHEFHQRARRHRRGDDKLLVGLAQNCGQSCTVRLKHQMVGKNDQIHMDTIRIRLERQVTDEIMDRRRRRRRRKRSNTQNFADFRPIVQTMEFDNYTLFRHSNVSPKCFYNARVIDNREQSVVNLCDWNGGLFGTLLLLEGTFVVEPLVEDTDEKQQKDSGEAASVDDDDGIGVLRKRKRHLLAAELDSDLRAHLFYRLQPHSFEKAISDPNQKDLSTTTKTTTASETGNNTMPMLTNYSTLLPAGATADGVWPSNSPPLLVVPTAVVAVGDDGSAENRRRRSKRFANSWEHFVEVLVVADNKMLLYHQHNLENYVLTLFSTVSSIYRHASLGAAINVIVVKLVVIKNEHVGPDVSNRAQETLQRFCKWQNSFNDRNDEALNHHDVAILLTRHDICRATNKCDTLGLAELGTMCDGRKSCAIIEDNGLSAAFTIAHELGHIFNIPHDDERKCSEFMPLNKNSFHIMAPTLEYNTNPWSWSPCSSAMLLRYLDYNREQTQCLFDKPVERRYYDHMFEPPAPGAIYSVSQQCKFVFGVSAEICPYMPTCRRLWCSVSFGYQMGCRTQHMPWADGTPCGDNMWCHQGQCVGTSPTQRKPVDGGWGEWKPWRECSRTCGGGVQKSFRDCDSPLPENGGKYCIGQRERYRPCNIQDCQWDTPGFRELQCTEFDGVDIGIHGVPTTMTWVPKYTAVAENERCRLYCRANDSAAFYMLKDKVTDGTPCDRNGDDICIDGTCHKAGCDHRLGSEMKRDICGLCGGNGSTCREVNGVYNERSTFGYNEVLRIPAGAAGIDITQTAHNGQKEDDNYLALRTSTGEFLLNGQYQVSVFRQQIPIMDTVLEYSGSDQTVERINGTGPLRSDIYLHVLSVGNLNNPNIRYHFMTPITTASATDATAQQQQHRNNNSNNMNTGGSNKFYWRAESNWTECSMKCQGVQSQYVRCVEAFSNRLVADAHCAAISRLNTQKRMCNVDCFYKYLQRLNTDSAVHKWYQYVCVRSYTNGTEEQAREDECVAAGLKKPPSLVAADGGSANGIQQHLSPVPSTDQQQQLMPAGRSRTRHTSYPAPNHRWTKTQWAYSQWSQCSESCGTGGISRRNLHCIDTRNGHKLDVRFCDGIPHEASETECNRTPCPHWVYSQWYQCSRSCGGGLRMRHASCQDAAGRDLDVRMCAAETKIHLEKCNEQPCTQWNFGTWSTCSVSCGHGVQRRDAMCVREIDGQPLEEKDCEPRERILEKQCQMAACPHWKLGPWSQCSVSCGQDGYQTRLVQCVDSAERKLSDQHCMDNKKQQQQQQMKKPQSYKMCSPGPCPTWYHSVSQQCKSVFGAAAEVCPYMPTCRRLWCSVSFGYQMGCRTQHMPWADGTPCGDNMWCHQGQCVGTSPTQRKSTTASTTATAQQQHRNNHSNGNTRGVNKFYWRAESNWTECSMKCQGVQSQYVRCVEAFSNRLVADAHCAAISRLNTQKRMCNVDCFYKYLQRLNTDSAVHKWYQYVCVRSYTNGTEEQAREDECVAAGLKKPPSLVAADGGSANGIQQHLSPVPSTDQQQQLMPSRTRDTSYPTPNHRWAPSNSSKEFLIKARRKIFRLRRAKRKKKTQWAYSQWSQCSESCGTGGISRRNLHCIDTRNGHKLDVRFCDGIPHEASETECNRTPCPHWVYSQWYQCSRSCGGGLRMRHASCQDAAGRDLDVRMCAAETKIHLEKCNEQPCTQWNFGTWSTCSVSCGHGVQRRDAMCVREIDGQPLEEKDCEPRERILEKQCQMAACPHWKLGPWSQCSVSCGQDGYQTRLVQCVDSAERKLSDQHCMDNKKQQQQQQMKKPQSYKMCSPGPCPTW